MKVTFNSDQSSMSELKKAKILVVDDNVTNLNIVRKALEESYDLVLLPSGEKALKVLERVSPDLILLDVEMPEMDGFTVIQEIKKMPLPISEIPVIFLTAKDDAYSEFEGLDLGAVDYIAKPFSFPLLLKRVGLHLKLAQQQRELQNYSTNLEGMVREKTQVITQLQYAIVHGLADMVEKRDGSTGGHLVRTRNFLKVLMQKVLDKGVYKDEFQNIDIELYAHASQMHDVGKISIPDSILLKEGRLTDVEFIIMREHTVIGASAIRSAMSNIQDAEFLSVAAEFASSHHEKWNGTGYPNNLAGENIPITGRLMAIVDVYDALISERPYKKPMPHDEAVALIKEESGKHFDPKLVNIFLEVADTFKEISLIHACDEQA